MTLNNLLVPLGPPGAQHLCLLLGVRQPAAQGLWQGGGGQASSHRGAAHHQGGSPHLAITWSYCGHYKVIIR